MLDHKYHHGSGTACWLEPPSAGQDNLHTSKTAQEPLDESHPGNDSRYSPSGPELKGERTKAKLSAKIERVAFQDALLHNSVAASGSLKYSDHYLIPSDINKTFLPRELSLTGYLFKQCGSVGKSQSSSSLSNTPRLHAQTHGAALTSHWAGVPDDRGQRDILTHCGKKRSKSFNNVLFFNEH